MLFELKLFSLILASAPVLSDTERVFNRMFPIARYVYESAPSDKTAGYIIFFLVFILSAIVYKLGFAKKLSLGKNIIIYIFLFLGCILLTVFAIFSPMIEGLIITALVLILYKIRLWREKKEEQEA